MADQMVLKTNGFKQHLSYYKKLMQQQQQVFMPRVNNYNQMQQSNQLQITKIQTQKQNQPAPSLVLQQKANSNSKFNLLKQRRAQQSRDQFKIQTDSEYRELDFEIQKQQQINLQALQRIRDQILSPVSLLANDEQFYDINNLHNNKSQIKSSDVDAENLSQTRKTRKYQVSVIK